MAEPDAQETPLPALPPAIEPDPAPPGPGGVRGLLGGRPFSIYLVLAAGLAVLLLLLALVVLTGRDDQGPQPPICLPIAPDQAERALTRGQVAQVNVLTEEGRPETGPLAVTLDLTDGNCRELPKGIQSQPDFYRLIGIVTVYNQTRAGEQRIVLSWRQQGNIPADLLATPTATVVATEPLTADSTATATPEPTATRETTATPAPAIATPTRRATPIPEPTDTATATASPTPRAATPAATPVRATPTPTRSPIRVPATPGRERARGAPTESP